MFKYFAFDIFFQNKMKNLKILNMLTCYQKRGYYKMPVTSLSQIKSDFQNFKGGSIDLSKVSIFSGLEKNYRQNKNRTSFDYKVFKPLRETLCQL